MPVPAPTSERTASSDEVFISVRGLSWWRAQAARSNWPMRSASSSTWS
jgi:hypothetical protein